MQSEASAVVQAVGGKALLLLTQRHCQDSVGAAAHIHSDQASCLMLPVSAQRLSCHVMHGADFSCEAASCCIMTCSFLVSRLCIVNWSTISVVLVF